MLCIQEIDIGCERSGGEDTGTRIAEALKMNYFFACEFEELHSPMRKPRDQGGGLHGNAILTKYDYEETRVLSHVVEPVNWTTEGESFREPRRGGRITPVAKIKTHQGPLRVYGPHLELFCGASHRMAQMDEIMSDVEEASRNSNEAVLIGGDLNTGAHGFGRLVSLSSTVLPFVEL